MPAPVIDRAAIDAILFDLDGVLTKTAAVHAAAWKRLFDEYLEGRSARDGVVFTPFDVDRDYRSYVDGRPRYEGVASFLAARGLALPWGSPDDAPDAETVCGLGNRKNAYVQEHLATHGVEVYEPAVGLARAARAKGFKTAVVSASENCAAVLDATGLGHLFDVRVDGLDLARYGLRGKPAPDSFLEAATRLGVEPRRAVVVEDAIAGVEAGRAGGFGLVVGVDRTGQPDRLLRGGADVVVSTLGGLTLVGLAGEVG
jgi:beta-phosphoglucomutase family hydrolase